MYHICRTYARGRCTICFGSTSTGTETKTTNPNPLTSSAASGNLSFVQGLRDKGFTGYGGNQVADFSPMQQQAFGMAEPLTQNAYGYIPGIEGLINQYGSSPAGSVSPQTIDQRMPTYMSQYVQQALGPQLQAQQEQFDVQNRGADAGATMAGAYGNDAQDAIYRAKLAEGQGRNRMGLIGQAYQNAFNTAIGAGAQDVANNLGAQQFNVGAREQGLGRQLGAAGALQGAGSWQQTIPNLLNQYGGAMTAQDQAKLNAAYNQWQLGQAYPFQTAGLVNQTVQGSANALPSSTTTEKSAPDNSGWGLAGTMLGGIGGSFLGMPGLGASLGGMAGNALMGSGAVNPTAYTGGAGLPYAMPWGKYADGGRVPGDRPVVVGERGPELFMPGRSGVVVPNEIMAAAREKRAQKMANPLGRAFNLAA